MGIDTSPAALRKLYDEYLGDYENTKVMRDTLLAVAAEKEAQATVDAGALRMALNVLRRAGKDEVADALEAGAVRGAEKEAQQSEPSMSMFASRADYDASVEAQHHPEQHLEMVAPADVPLPEPDRVDDRASESAWSQSLMHQYAEAYAKAAVAAEREMRDALELIAAPKRPDGTWNRDREACRQLAADALGRYDEKQKGTV